LKFLRIFLKSNPEISEVISVPLLQVWKGNYQNFVKFSTTLISLFGLSVEKVNETVNSGTNNRKFAVRSPKEFLLNTKNNLQKLTQTSESRDTLTEASTETQNVQIHM
jgi:hypothetical protein